jgi:hypothetical protein
MNETKECTLKSNHELYSIILTKSRQPKFCLQHASHFSSTASYTLKGPPTPSLPCRRNITADGPNISPFADDNLHQSMQICNMNLTSPPDKKCTEKRMRIYIQLLRHGRVTTGLGLGLVEAGRLACDGERFRINGLRIG